MIHNVSNPILRLPFLNKVRGPDLGSYLTPDTQCIKPSIKTPILLLLNSYTLGFLSTHYLILNYTLCLIYLSFH